MITRKLWCLAIIMLLAFALLQQAAAAADSGTGTDYVSKTTEKCLSYIAGKDYAAAKRLALQLAASPQWKKGNLETAGAIRAIVDAFRAAGRVDLADKVLKQAHKTHKATGDAAIALQGRCLPESVRSGLPVTDLIWRIPMASRGITVLPVFDPKKDLKRLRLGNQASVIKVMDAANKKVVYTRGLDGVMWAPVLEAHRQSIYSALGIQASSLDKTALQLVNGYSGFAQKKECIALLGIIGSAEGTALSDDTRKTIQTFLVKIMRTSTNVVLRRHACLSLALQDSLQQESVDAVVTFYEKSKNLWETFPVQQVFEYQKDCISLMPGRSQFRTRIAAINEIYTPNILKFL